MVQMKFQMSIVLLEVIFFRGTVDFNPGTETDTNSSTSSVACFLTKINSDGEYAWTQILSGGDFYIDTGVTADTDGNCYVAEIFSGATDFDPGTK